MDTHLSSGLYTVQTHTPQENWATIDQKLFRHTMARFCTGVTIVTSKDENFYYGCAVSSFCSLSLSPPLVLICLDQKNKSHAIVKKTGVFAINILAAGYEWIAQQFASHQENKFTNIDYSFGLIALPLLNASLATLECVTNDISVQGDHSIFVGKVVAATVYDEYKDPMVYYMRDFHHILF